MLVNPTEAAQAETVVRDVDAAARAMGLQIEVLSARTSREIDAVFAAFARERPDALFVVGNALFNSRRVQLVHLATRHAIPATYGARDYPEIGGLYRSHPQGREAGGLAGLAGVQVRTGHQRPDRQDARPTVPPTLLSIADEVIE